MPKADLRPATPQELHKYLTQHGWVRDESIEGRDHTAYALGGNRLVYYVPTSGYQFHKILRRLANLEKRHVNTIHREMINYVS